jgi:hypothetical protein
MSEISIHATRSQFAAATASLSRAVTFTAYRVPRGSTQPLPLEIPACLSLAGALNAALAGNCLNHRDALLIRQQDSGRGGNTLHAWAIKRKSQARYVRGSDGLSHPVHELYAAELFSVAVEAFEPVRPFDAFSDDASGRDRQLVEGGR